MNTVSRYLMVAVLFAMPGIGLSQQTDTAVQNQPPADAVQNQPPAADAAQQPAQSSGSLFSKLANAFSQAPAGAANVAEEPKPAADASIVGSTPAVAVPPETPPASATNAATASISTGAAADGESAARQPSGGQGLNGLFSSMGKMFSGGASSSPPTLPGGDTGLQSGPQADPQSQGQQVRKDERPKDLLSNLELGETLRRSNSHEASRDAWLVADEYVRAWEDEAKNSPEKLLQSIGEGLGSVLINDTVRRYDGSDYERVALATKLALSHLALGNWDKARIEIRKMHEREAIIADFRSKEVETLKKERDAKKLADKEVKDLKGYPVEVFDSPEVVGLRNSYQNAFGHYLAGFVYEQSGETSLAAAGYRQAIELQPGLTSLQSALAGLDKRIRKRGKTTDTLIVMEAGQIPVKTSTMIPLPVPTHNGLVIVPTSFPSMTPPVRDAVPTMSIDGAPVPLSVVTNYDAMARRELRDSMPGVIVRGTIRAIAKGVVNSEMQKQAGFFGALLSTVLTTATEKADTRMWRSLPSHVAIARLNLKPGKHVVDINGRTSEIEVAGAYSLVTLRPEAAGTSATVATTPAVAEATLLASSEDVGKSAKKAARKAQKQ